MISTARHARLAALIGLVAGPCIACAVQRPAPTLSPIDAQYRLDRLNAAGATGTRSESVRAYQTLLRPVLGSECRMLPSDSAYSQHLFAHCGTLEAIPRSMARVLFEPDAPFSGVPAVATPQGVKFLDVPECGEP